MSCYVCIIIVELYPSLLSAVARGMVQFEEARVCLFVHACAGLDFVNNLTQHESYLHIEITYITV